MAKVENLTQKILDDAKQRADEILREHEEKRRQVIDRKNRELEEELNRIGRSAENEAARSRERVLSNARLTTRNEELTIRQEKMDEAFQKAKEKLSDMPNAEFKTFVENTLKKLGDAGAQAILVPENRKQALGDKVAGIPVETDHGSADGFSIRSERVFLNYRFDSLVDSMREEMEQDIRASLFEKEA